MDALWQDVRHAVRLLRQVPAVTEVAQLDLGGRTVSVIPTPGHNETHVAFYDDRTAILFSGDFLIAGRLLIEDTTAYHESALRVLDFLKARPLMHILGGHIELDEDPEMAALREAKEESGLEVELIGERPPTTEPGTRALIAPRFLDIHRITDTHEHIGMIYWARPKNGRVTLAAEEHHDIRWCSDAELDALQPPMSQAVKWYCRKALEEISMDRTWNAGCPPTKV